MSEKVSDSRALRPVGRPRFDWRLSAACRDLDPDLFFPVGPAGPAVTQVAEAKQVCLACPVRQPCLDWALRHYQDGIWGGTTELERKALRAVRGSGPPRDPWAADLADRPSPRADREGTSPRAGLRISRLLSRLGHRGRVAPLLFP